MKRLVIGCGYLGLPVARTWAGQGDTVYVMTRSSSHAKDFEAAGLSPIIADITKPRSLPKLPQVATVLFSVGMDRSKYDDINTVYVGGLSNVLSRLHPETDRLIYISSTGVYGDVADGVVDEESPAHPQRDGGRACLAAEQLIADSSFAGRSTILRLAGIYGPGRIPSLEKVRQKNWIALTGEGHINLIHRDDAVLAILRCAELRICGETILVSDGISPTRREYYQVLADEVGVGTIEWPADDREIADYDPARRTASSKIISNQKMKHVLGIQPQWSDLRSGLRNAIEE